jgi:hypothetical protein
MPPVKPAISITREFAGCLNNFEVQNKEPDFQRLQIDGNGQKNWKSIPLPKDIYLNFEGKEAQPAAEIRRLIDAISMDRPK